MLTICLLVPPAATETCNLFDGDHCKKSLCNIWYHQDICAVFMTFAWPTASEGKLNEQLTSIRINLVSPKSVHQQSQLLVYETIYLPNLPIVDESLFGMTCFGKTIREKPRKETEKVAEIPHSSGV